MTYPFENSTYTIKASVTDVEVLKDLKSKLF